MSSKRKTSAVECFMDYGAGSVCYFSKKECEYRDNRRNCEYYRMYFMSGEERAKIQEKGLAKTATALGLRKLNYNEKGD